MAPTPLDRARELILSLTKEEDAKPEIDRLKTLKPDQLNSRLADFYNTAPHLAELGDTKGISIILRVFEYFKDLSHDRMLLHYVAQAEANHELNALNHNPEEQEHTQKIKEALTLISDAFKDANDINAQVGEK